MLCLQNLESFQSRSHTSRSVSFPVDENTCHLMRKYKDSQDCQLFETGTSFPVHFPVIFSQSKPRNRILLRTCLLLELIYLEIFSREIQWVGTKILAFPSLGLWSRMYQWVLILEKKCTLHIRLNKSITWKLRD